MITQMITNLYTVRKSLVLYLFAAIISSLFLLIFGGENMYELAIILIFMLIITPSLEVMNHQSKSGYDIFVLTLPVKRKQIVRAHYLFYGMTVLLAFIVAAGAVWIADLFIEEVLFDTTTYSVFGLGIALSLLTGALWYPLLYLLGSEKSEGILIGALLFSILGTLGMERALGRIIGGDLFLTRRHDPALLLFLLYFFSSIFIYCLSFFIGQLIYERKEF